MALNPFQRPKWVDAFILPAVYFRISQWLAVVAVTREPFYRTLNVVVYEIPFVDFASNRRRNAVPAYSR